MRVLDPVVRDTIDHLTKGFETELIEFRRDLHQHPELGREEHLTTAKIVERLTRAGLAPRVLASGTGVICDLVGSAGAEPHIGLRADIDALPLHDAKDVPYRSAFEGRCHACGHDAHTTIVLGAALVLAELAKQGELTDSVRLIFEPAEELTPGGALDVIADHGLDGLDQVFALHCDPRLEVGKLGFRSGPITGGADRIQVNLTGPGGHTARPHLTTDLVYALGVIVTDLPGALSRLCDPRAGLTMVWGHIEAGTAANTIPQSGMLAGTLRCLDTTVWESAHARVPDLVRAIAAPYGVDVEVDVHTSVPPCVNDEAATAYVRAVALELFAADQVTPTDQSLGGEDFAWMAARTPASLVRLGVRGQETADVGDLHRGTFDIDEAAIGVGVRLFVGLALAD